MLAQLYRFGPGRQRIMKGFVIEGKNSEAIIRKLKSHSKLPESVSFSLSAESSSGIWVDSGIHYMHTMAERDRIFAHMASNIVDLAAQVQQAGGKLLPNAVRINPQNGWTNCLCADHHYLEVEDEVEKLVFCNLLRSFVPLFIAITGKAGVDNRGIENVGSRRLLNSDRHFATRRFYSLSDTHLARFTKYVRREFGISGLQYLDINPLEGNLVEVRFLDGQFLLSNVRAQALLLQAILIRARRMVRNGFQERHLSQSVLERNRARAIVSSMHAQMEVEVPPAFKKGNRGSRKTNFRQYKLEKTDHLLLGLLEKSNRELQALEVEYAEIAPLVLGPSLRQTGLPGIRNENELLRAIVSQKGQKGLLPWIEKAFQDPHNMLGDLISKENSARYPGPSKNVRRFWLMMLSQGLQTPSKKLLSSKNKQGDRKAYDKVKSKKAVQSLGQFLGNRSNQDPTALVRGLAQFHRQASNHHLGRALGLLGKEKAKEIRGIVRRASGNPIRINPSRPNWESRVQDLISKRISQAPLCLGELRVPVQQEGQTVRQVIAIAKKLDLSILHFVWYRFPPASKEAGKLKLEFLFFKS